MTACSFDSLVNHIESSRVAHCGSFVFVLLGVIGEAGESCRDESMLFWSFPQVTLAMCLRWPQRSSLFR